MTRRWLIAILLVIAHFSQAAPSEESRCRQWALEDGVPGKQVLDYVRKCAAELVRPIATSTDAPNRSQFITQPTTGSKRD